MEDHKNKTKKREHKKETKERVDLREFMVTKFFEQILSIYVSNNMNEEKSHDRVESMLKKYENYFIEQSNREDKEPDERAKDREASDFFAGLRRDLNIKPPTKK